jgi:hypothetical protein
MLGVGFWARTSTGEDAAGLLWGGDLPFFALEWVGNMSHFMTGWPNLIGLLSHRAH